MIRVIALAFMFLLGFYVGKEWTPTNAAIYELVFRSYVMGCVDGMSGSSESNDHCMQNALKFQNEIKEIIEDGVK